jgi:hypothetical protein
LASLSQIVPSRRFVGAGGDERCPASAAVSALERPVGNRAITTPTRSRRSSAPGRPALVLGRGLRAAPRMVFGCRRREENASGAHPRRRPRSATGARSDTARTACCLAPTLRLTPRLAVNRADICRPVRRRTASAHLAKIRNLRQFQGRFTAVCAIYERVALDRGQRRP